MFSEKQGNVLHGILLIVLFSFSAFYIAEFQFIKNLSLSPLIVGIILGMLYANSLRDMGSGHKILLETSTSCRYRPLRIPVDLPKRYRHRSLGHTHRRDYRHLHHSIGDLGGETVEDGQ